MSSSTIRRRVVGVALAPAPARAPPSPGRRADAGAPPAGFDDKVSPAMLALQQRQLVAAQLVHAQAQAQAAQAQAAQALHRPGSDPAARARYVVDKKQREVYVGNLTPGVASIDVVREVFDGALARVFPESVANGPAVINVNMDGSQKNSVSSSCVRTARVRRVASGQDRRGREAHERRKTQRVRRTAPGWIPSAVPANVVPGYDERLLIQPRRRERREERGRTGTAGTTSSAPSKAPEGHGGGGYRWWIRWWVRWWVRWWARWWVRWWVRRSAASAAGAGTGRADALPSSRAPSRPAPPNDPVRARRPSPMISARRATPSGDHGDGVDASDDSSAAAVIVAFADGRRRRKASAALHGEKIARDESSLGNRSSARGPTQAAGGAGGTRETRT